MGFYSKRLSRLLLFIFVIGLFVSVLPFVYSAKPYEGKRIRVLVDQRSEIDEIKKLLPSFENETGMKVDLIISSEGPIEDKTTLELTAPSTKLDAIFVKFFYIKDYAQRDLLAPMDKLLEHPKALNDISKPFLDIAKYNGHLYGIPLYQDCNVLAYRADLFAKYKIHVPKTMDDLMKAAKIITENEKGVYGIAMRGARQGRPNWDWSSFLEAWGGSFLDAKGNPVINSEASVKSLKYYTDLLKSYGPPGIASYNWTDVQGDFLEGKVAMMYDSVTLAIRATDPKISKVADKISFAVVPKGPVKREPGFNTWIFSIPKNSSDENKKASMKFIEWVISPDIAKKVGWSVPNTALNVNYNIPPYHGYKEAKNLLDVTKESLKEGSPEYRPLIPQLGQVMDIVDTAINSSLAGIKTPKEALDEAQTELVNLLKK